jgi:hypothetical protein
MNWTGGTSAEFQFRHNNRSEADIFGKAVAGC